MKKTIASKILSILQKKSGSKLSVKELHSELFPAKDKVKKKKKYKLFRRSPPEELLQDPHMILAELELLGLIRQSGNRIFPADPFLLTGKVSMNPQGLVFISPRGADPAARDIFVAPRDALEAMPGDEVQIRLKDRTKDRFEGSVIRILNRSRTLYRMSLLESKGTEFLPGTLLDTPGRMMAALDVQSIPEDVRANLSREQNVVVELTGETRKMMGVSVRMARYSASEGSIHEDTDFERILIKYDLDPEFPPEIPLPPADMGIHESSVRDWKERKDIRDLFTVTIDGADSKDFDDAISLVPGNKDGKWKLYVHIADVSHYVTKGSALDREAQKRATSVYLTDRVVPMLPGVLSENLCSLVAKTNRLAFTAEMDLDAKTGTITNSRFYKSIIYVDKRLTYDIAEDFIDNQSGLEQHEENSEVRSQLFELLGHMWSLAKDLRVKRIARGKIDLDIPEPKIITDRDGKVQSIEYRKRLKSSILIEEFMLSANQAVAKFLKKKSARVLYRVHEPMDESKLENLNTFFQIYNVPLILKSTDQHEIIRALDTIGQMPDAKTIQNIFQLILLRSFMQASYRGEPLGHWGLGFTDYCHFTSPIRRYPDLVVHRVLHAILSSGKQPYSSEEIDDLGILTSEQERKAMEAERDMHRLKVIRSIESSGQKEFRGFITGFKTDRIFLELEDLPAEGVVTQNHITRENQLILPDRFSVYINRLSRPAFLGEKWDLELERIDIEEIRLYFKPVWKRIQKAFD